MANAWFEAPRGLYVHFPFCRKKCPYCGFFVLAGRHELHDAYWQAVLAEVRERTAQWGREFATVYLGGGTPSLSSARSLGRFLEQLLRLLGLPPDAEITVEANPETLDRERLHALRAVGVNRLSIGAQSGLDPELRLLGRTHTPREVEQAVDRARRAGFENLNLDLIFGLPGQTPRHLEASLHWAVALEPEHLSVYSLTLEPGTLFHREARRGRLQLPDEATMVALYRLREDFLESHGYHLYEISNFARPGYESRHNLLYWCHRPYLGVGLSAASFRYHTPTAGERWVQHRSLVRYLQDERTPTVEQLDARALLLERVFLGIRLREGIRWPVPSVPEALEPYVRLRNGVLALTAEGRLVADRLAVELVAFLEQQGAEPAALLQKIRPVAC